MSHLSAALNSCTQLQADQPYRPRLPLLCLSNGHGEDVVAVRILQALQQHPTPVDITALPLVGEGHAYTQLGIPLIGSVQTMPSGGFFYMDGQQLMRDLRGGLLQLTWSQLKAVRNWVRSHMPEQVAILAVGDIVPLLFAWLSGANYAFVGTAKSEYYLRNETGLLPRQGWSRWEGWSGSVYHPWERWLMSHRQCQAVFPRDSLTAEFLQKWSIPAFDLGNPMMDQLEPVESPLSTYISTTKCQEQALTITLLPGSRSPEAYRNWQQILAVVTALSDSYPQSLLFLGAIAPHLELKPLCQNLIDADFQAVSQPASISDHALTFTSKNTCLILSKYIYNDCLHCADLAIAMTGTATEQFVGLGKPVITIPGNGPQFTYNFAEAQSRHLGPSIILLENPTQVAHAVQSLVSEPNRLRLIAENGYRRMGKPGAGERIADCLIKQVSRSIHTADAKHSPY